MSIGIRDTAKDLLRFVLAIALAVLTGMLAQIVFRIGPVPYTMHNTAVILSGLLLPPGYALLSQAAYLMLIALGLPMAAGFRGGIHVLLGYTGGYLVAFPIASMLMSILRRAYLRRRGVSMASIGRRDFAVLLLLSVIAVIPIYILGFIVFTYYALGSEKLFNWALSVSRLFGIEANPLLVLFMASVAVFIPQDLLIDHVIAVAVAKAMAKLLESRGISIE